MKKIISFILTISILFSFYSIAIPIKAFTNTSIEQFAEDMSELYEEESAEGKSIEDSVKCRVIVKATTKPETYGDAECIVGSNNIYVYQYSDAEMAEKAVEFYNGLPSVKWAELDGIVEGQAMSYGNHMVQGDETKEYVSVNNLPQEEVIVAVLDSGANFEADFLNGRVFDSGVNLSNSGFEGTAEDDNSHGSSVAGIIADNTTENVKIVAYKVLNENLQGDELSLMTAIYKAVENGSDIINLSLSLFEYSTMVYEAIKEAYDKGVIIVCSAGNDNEDVSTHYPASFDEVYAVGSIDKNGNRSFFSNYGEEIDFVAPGHNIELSEQKKDYGTSFSAPFVTAAAAMVKSVYHEFGFDEVKQKLIASCVPYEKLAYHDNLHIIEDFDLDCTDDSGLWQSILGYDAVDESLYYGHGMPQILSAIAQNSATASPPQISINSGTYNESFEIEISVPKNYKIYYTSDESYPSEKNGTSYSEPIAITETQSIRAVAYSPDGVRSFPVSCEYKMEYLADEADFTINSKGYITKYSGDLKEFIVPDTINGVTVTGIANMAFQNSNIVGIVLPETVTHIGIYSFKSSNLKYLKGKGVEWVNDAAFESCKELVKVDIPNLKKVGTRAFLNCRIRTVEFPELEEMEASAFANNNCLTYVNLPLITDVPYHAFVYCQSLKSVDMINAVSLDAGAFSYCYWLKNVNIPNLLEINSTNESYETYSVFRNCSNINELDFPCLKNLSTDCFNNCLSLKHINIPLVEVISKNAFYNCMSLTGLNINSATVVEEKAFYGTQSFESVVLPKVTKIYREAFQNSGLKSLDAPELTELHELAFAQYKFLTDEFIKNNTLSSFCAPVLETASNYAFAYTGALTKLELPALKSLGTDTFLESSVSYLYAPELESSASLPTADDSIVILSSNFTECSLDATDYNLTVYGTYGTYAETYANEYGLTFIGVPVIISHPASIYDNTAEMLKTEAIGFNLEYQWYGTDSAEKLNGTPLNDAADNTFDPSLFDSYPYYYCVITGKDGDYFAEIKTDIVENKLHIYAADYTELNSVLQSVPEDLSLYTKESVEALNTVISSIDWELGTNEQDKITEYINAIENAVNGLKYKPADYAALDKVLATVPTSLSIYTDESVAALNDVINSIDKNLDITKQEKIDEYVIAITNAVAALELKSADYAELEEVLKTVPDDLSIYTDNSSAELKTILAEIDKNLNITNQEQVDKWAEAISAAVGKLVLKPADYSTLEKALATVPSDLSIYTPESVAKLESIIDNIDYCLDITQQEKVDEYTEQITQSVENLEEECWIIRLFRMIIYFFKDIILCFKNCMFNLFISH